MSTLTPFRRLSRLTSLATALAVLLTLAACGNDAEDVGATDAATTEDGTTGADQSTTDATPPATSGKFVALTYNIKGLPDAITGWDTSAHMEEISPMLEPYALIGLQEDFVEVNHDLLIAKPTHAHKDWFSAKKDSTKGYGSGLSLLSKMAVVKQGHEHYASCLGLIDHASDCLASKGVMFTRIQLSAHPEATIDVYNTHMEAGGSKEEDAMRLEQFEHILKMMETHSKGRAVIVMGDTNLRLNDPPDVPAILKLNKDGGMVDSCEATSCTEPNHIDRFHFRSGDKVTLKAVKWTRELGFVDAKGEDLSDHPAISTEFTWSVK